MRHPPWATAKACVRTALASLPGSASLVQALNECESIRTIERIQELSDNLRNELESIQARVGDLEAAIRQCQDFPELLELTVDKVRKEFGEAKRAKYARVLARLVAEGDTRSHDEKVDLIEGLDSLSEADLRVLGLFDSNEQGTIRDLDWEAVEQPDEGNDRFWRRASHLAKLESKGLILTVPTRGTVVYKRGTENDDTARWLETKYRLLPLGRLLIEKLFH